MNVRVNITLSDELKNWYASEAKRMGVSASALMVLAMEQFKKGNEIERRIADIEKVIRKLDK